MENKFVLHNIDRFSLSSGDLIEDVGEASFSGTGTTVEVSTDLSEIVSAVFTPKTVTINANDAPLATDGVVTSGAITVARAASGTSGLTFYYRLLGRRYD